MYSIKVTEEIEIKHFLNLDYPSPENKLHSHNWTIIVNCTVDRLNNNDKIIDEYTIRKLIKKYDKVILNDYLNNPTPEEFMKQLLKIIPYCMIITIIDKTNFINTEYYLTANE